MRTYGAAAAATARTYAPRPSVAALATGLRVDPLDGSRVELAPATSSFPAIANAKTSLPPHTALHNGSTLTSLATSGGVLAYTVGASGGDFNTATHSSGHYSRQVPWQGREMRLTTHVSGAGFGGATHLIGLGIWDPTSGNGKTARIIVGLESGAYKVYGEYATVSGSAAVSSGDLASPGVWLEMRISADGTYTSYWQVAAAGPRPAAGWTQLHTIAGFVVSYSSLWATIRYGLCSAGVSFSGNVSAYDDSQMSVAGVRSTRDGVGIGVSASSPEITLIDAAPVDWTVCTQARLRAALGAVGTLRDGETGTVEFQIDGGSWVAASAATVGVGATTTIKLRLVSTGLTLASADFDAIQSMRLT